MDDYRLLTGGRWTNASPTITKQKAGAMIALITNMRGHFTENEARGYLQPARRKVRATDGMLLRQASTEQTWNRSGCFPMSRSPE
jgi:hypothetical protein